jgi:hypothetical protein
VAQFLDQLFAGGSREKSHDDVGVGDIGKLSALFGETLDIVMEGLIRLLFTTPEVPRVTRAHVGPLEVPPNTLTRSFQLWICLGGRSSSHARAMSDRNRGSYRMMTRLSVAPPN